VRFGHVLHQLTLKELSLTLILYLFEMHDGAKIGFLVLEWWRQVIMILQALRP
jgi:hypothetical protein